MTKSVQQRGLTLVEVLVTMVLLTIVLVPAIQALQTSMTGAAVHADLTSVHYRLMSRMEDVLAEPIASLEAAAIDAGSAFAPSSYSDAAGPPARLLVYLALFDGDNADADDDPFTGQDNGIVWVRVAAEGTVYELRAIRSNGL